MFFGLICICRLVGIGRREGLKNLCPLGRPGSIPGDGTTSRRGCRGVPSLEMVGAGFYIVHIPVLACFIRPGVGALLEESFPTVGSVCIAEYQAWRLGVARQ